MYHQVEGHDRQVRPLTCDAGGAEGEPVVLGRDRGAAHRGTVEGLVLQKENGVLQADGRGQEALRVGRGRGRSNLEARSVPEEGLDVLGVAEAPWMQPPQGTRITIGPQFPSDR